MTRVLRRESLANENVPEVPVTVLTKDLGPPTVSVHFAAYGTFDFIVE